MLFSSPVFLFLFLPCALALYFLLGRRLRNLVLLASSLFFYAWGEQAFVAIMVVSIAANYGFGLWVDRAREGGGARLAVAAAVVFNLALLSWFKYATWLWASLDRLLVALGAEAGSLPEPGEIHLPLGISFFTFQAMSYVIDVYRGDGKVQRHPIDFAVYIALFPQLIAGPIVRYRDIAGQLVDRVVTRPGFAEGVRRFIVGLAKKVLIANVVAVPADAIFAVPAGELSAPVAWFGIACYTLQIYFDFSGYSDMAIGLGRMLGFRFLENFRYPYMARSVTEFWRRWHISLSSWLRDYLYKPLGGNRRGRGRTLFNLLFVFALCGIWHGAAWTFLAFGLFHGAFLIVERLGLKPVAERAPAALGRTYAVLVWALSMVFFRSESMADALSYHEALFGLGHATSGVSHVRLYLDPVVALALVAGAVGSTPWAPWLDARLSRWLERRGSRALALGSDLAVHAALLVALTLSALQIAAGTYDPFIYFRF